MCGCNNILALWAGDHLMLFLFACIEFLLLLFRVTEVRPDLLGLQGLLDRL